MFICKEDNRRRSGLRQDCQMPQMDIYTSHCHELFLNSSLAYISARADYMLIRELPSGKGFADIVFLPHSYSDKPAMIVELKWNKHAEGAIAQIKDKKYVKALEGYTGDLLLVGINYQKKSKKHDCIIEKI